MRVTAAGRWVVALAVLAGVATQAGAAAPPPLPGVSKPPVADIRLADHPMRVPDGTPPDAIGNLLRSTLAGSNKYTLNTWWTRYMSGIEPYQVAGERARTTNTIDSEEVRRYTSVAYALAVTLATGAYDPTVTGLDAVGATERVVELVDYVTSTHTANLAGDYGWGGSVQSGMWAGQIATAGWLIGAALPAATQAFVGRMLEYEADVITARKVHYLRDRAGHLITPGNSGAEELAWDGFALWTAVELLPHHYRRSVWAQAAYQRFVGAYARPADVTSTRVVNGHTLRWWLGGSNAESNGFVVNHHRVNPDYTTDISLWAAPVSGIVGDGVPAAMLEGADTTYRALTGYSFSSPPARAPGGTVYKPGSTAVYYPSGADWGAHREVVYASLDVQSAVLAPAWQVRAKATKWAVQHLNVTRTMQARYSTGQIYGPLTEDHYRAREEHAAFLLGTAYLTWWLGANSRLDVDGNKAESKTAVW